MGEASRRLPVERTRFVPLPVENGAENYAGDFAFLLVPEGNPPSAGAPMRIPRRYQNRTSPDGVSAACTGTSVGSDGRESTSSSS